MTIENNLKQIIGEQAFQICSLAAQLEEVTTELNKLKEDKNEDK